MYRITYDGLTIFDPYGNANEVVSDASMSVEVNASAYLDFTMTMTHPLYDTIRERAGVVTLTWDSTVLFEGIIESIEMDIQGNKSISCVSAMDYLNDTHVRPYSTVAGEADLTAPSSVDGYFQWLIDQHNDHVLDASKMFDVGINQGANLQQNNFIYRSSESEPTTASELTDQILDSLGGYLTMRYEDGRKVLDLYADLHTMNAQIVDFGVNITDFTKTTDTTDQYTAILLHGGSPTFEGGDLEAGDWSHWETHPNTPLVGDQTHGGSVASYFVSGTGEYINDSFFYSRPGRRYKATVYVKNERGSNVTIRGSYQYEQAGDWATVNVNSSLVVENKGDQWVEFSFDFQPNLSEYTKIRPRWYFDNVGNDGNRRVYLDDFSFSQIEGDTEVSEDPIGLKQVPDGVSSFDADVFKSGDVLYSTSAVERYGYKEEVFEDTTITNIDDLVQAGIKELNKSKDPQITLDIKAVDLALFMEGYTHLNVGDAVRVRSAIHDTDEFLMVNSITLDLQDPGQSEYVIGKAYDSLTGQQSGFLRSLNSGINSSLDAVASLDQTTKDQAIQIGSVEQVANQAQQTANNAQNTANNAQQTANSNKQSISDLQNQQSEQDKLIEQMQQGIDESEKEINAINDRIEQMDTEAGEIQANIDAVRQEAQTNFETAKNAADAAGQRADAAQEAVDSLRESTSSELQNVKDSVSGVRSDVDAVEQKAADLASELDGTKATVEQVTTDLGEVKTTVSNAATKADQALQVSTSASQTATEARTTATSAYQDAQSALTQSSIASQTANAVKTELETKYSTTDEIAEQYATKSLVEQTSQSITSTVEATYATKATVEALENIANNAVQTWMGSGVPTLSNKPASDWNTADLKSQHSGDIYYDTNTGYSYRFGSSDGKNYSWSLIKDTDISKAVADAAKAQQTAEGVSDEVTQLKTDIPATYATKTEVKQTTDSIKSSVSEVATTANSALSKATTVEQTANGLQTTVTEQASKIDQNTTTISQVSQKVDSVSSTITQVSGRVDDVEDKADAAQGTANSALSQASRVEQSLDSFKTSVSRDYQTKTDALSQKSELEQNINSFKTTVSETYTTKDEFNALSISGANLVKNSRELSTTYNMGRWSIDSSGEFSYAHSTDSTGGSWSEMWIPLYAEYNSITGQCMVSFEGKNLNSLFGVSLAAFNSSNGRVEEIKNLMLNNSRFSSSVLDDGWTRYVAYFTASEVSSINKLSSATQYAIQFKRSPAMSTTNFQFRKPKVELGTKPTAWSPAPEDFDGKYTSKTEFKQTTDKISATATAASQNASSALSKVSSLEVSVDGIDTKVEEVASDADEAVKTASQVSQRVDSLSSTITQVQGDIDRIDANSQNFITNPQFKSGNVDGVANTNMNATDSNPGVLPGTATTFGKNSSGYDNRAENVRIKFIKNHTYRIEIDARLASDNAYTGSEGLGLFFWFMTADNPGLSNNQYTSFSNLIPSETKEWTHASYDYTPTMGDDDPRIIFRPAYRVAPSSRWLVTNFTCTDVTAIAEAQKDADTANSTANSALSKSSSVEQNLNSFKTNVSQTYETKNDALNKQSSLQQSVNNLRTEVSETYTTKTDFTNLNNAATKTYQFHTNNNQTGWYKLGTWSNTQQSDVCAITIYAGNGQNGRTDQNREVRVFIKDGFQSTASASGAFGVTIDRIRNADNAEVQVRATAANSCDVWYKGDTTYAAGRYTISIDPSSKWTHSGSFTASAPSSGTLQTQEYQTYSTKSYVDQTSRTVSLGVVEEYKKGQHGSALATQSDITATKDSITSTVSQTYLSKTDASNTYLNKNTAASTYATKTEVKQTSDSLTVTISSAVSKAESAATAASNAQNTANNAQSTANAAAGSSTNYIKNGGPNGTSNPIAGWTVSGNVYKHTFPGGQNHVDLGYTTLAHPIVVGRKYRLSLDARVTSGTFSSSDYFVFGLVSGWQSIRAQALTSSWKTYSGVVTSTREATQVFMSSYVGSSGSKVVEMRNVSMTDVTETYTAATDAQNTANEANTNATNANNRVGNLETCIKMTSDGVRVGKISNGNFTGYSALVNSAGSFDILDSSSKTLAFFNKDGLSIKSSSDRGMFVGFDSVSNSGYIGSMPKVATSEGGRSIDIGMNMEFSSGGYLNIINNLGGAGIAANGISLISDGGKRVSINMMDVRGAGVVLFDRDDNNNYSSVNIPTIHNFSEFNYIMCFFKTNDGNYFGGTAYHPDGKEYNFSTMGGQGTDMSYLKGTRWGFYGTRAERKTTFEIGPGYSRTVNDAVLHIVAIIGFDYYKTSG